VRADILDIFRQIFDNNVLLTSILAWLIAQVLKVPLTIVFMGRLDLRRFIEAGGMPSAHSALAVSLATSIGRIEGYNSTIFALSVMIALVVMYDAAGVRRAAGKQAAVLNDIIEQLYAHKGIEPEKLKELLGHTPVEVIAGAILGIVVSLLVI